MFVEEGFVDEGREGRLERNIMRNEAEEDRIVRIFGEINDKYRKQVADHIELQESYIRQRAYCNTVHGLIILMGLGCGIYKLIYLFI